ncbi:MAG: hypothetical protein R2704_10185 [Microthrixaceae bacterium]
MFDRPGGPKAVEPMAGRGRWSPNVSPTPWPGWTLADDLASLAAGRGGRVTLGTFQSISVRVLPALVTLARTRCPTWRSGWWNRTHYSELEDRLVWWQDLTFSIDGRTGSAVTKPPSDPAGSRIELGDDEFVVLAPRGEQLGDLVDPDSAERPPLVGEEEATAAR